MVNTAESMRVEKKQVCNQEVLCVKRGIPPNKNSPRAMAVSACHKGCQGHLVTPTRIGFPLLDERFAEN